MSLSVDQIVATLGLEPHPEGGFFVETYRAKQQLDLGAPYVGPRNVSTAIYYLLTPDTFSALHKVASDEFFHFYLGDAVEQLQLFPDGSSRMVEIGPDVLAGQHPQMLVPKGVWQGCRVKAGGKFALMGCTVSPGFDFADFELSPAAPLVARWPDQDVMIRALTRD